MGNRKLAFVGIADLDRNSSEEGIGLSIDLASPELAVSIKELADQSDVSELSIEELIAAVPEGLEDQQTIEIPEDPPRFMAFDPSQNPVICLRDKLNSHLSGCSYSSPITVSCPSIQSQTDTQTDEDILPMTFEEFLEFSKGEKQILKNRDRLIPPNHSHRQFQKCRR